MEKYSVKKPFTVLVAVLIVFLMGFVSVTNLRTDLLPDLSTPYLMVVTVYPGASPEKVESEVSEVLESALGTVAGVSSITSTSAENYSIVQLSFGADTDMNSALVKVSNTLDQNKDSLPDICLTPSIFELSMDMSSMMTVAVGREGADIYELSDFLEESVIPELERQEGVSSISTTGLVSKYIQVQLNESKIEDLNVLLLEQVDAQLALAKDQLDAAAAQLADGKAQLQEAIDTFGNVFASGVVDRVAGMVSDATLEIREKVQTLMNAIDNLIAFVNEPEIKEALTRVRDGLAEIMDEISATGLRDIDDLIDVVSKIRDLTDELTVALQQLQQRLDQETGGDGSTAGDLMDTLQIQQSLDVVYSTMQDVLDSLNRVPQLLDQFESVYAEMSQTQLEAYLQITEAQRQVEEGQKLYDQYKEEFENAKASAFANADVNNLLTIDVLSQLIYAQNFSMPAGYIDDKDDNSWLLKVGEEYDSIEDLEGALLLHIEGVTDIYLKDVADVAVVDNAAESFTRLNDERAVVLNIYKSTSASANAVSDACLAAFDELEARYDGLNFSVLSNQGNYITVLISSILSSMAIGAALAILILSLFLKDIKPTLVVGISIPLSVLFAVVLMYFTGINLNIMSLAGLSLGIGMLVDNSIVVIENIYRLRARGVAAPRAAVQGTRQVFGSIVSSTLTSVCVFLPVVFTEQITRELMLPMCLTIGYCLMASLLVAITVVPASASTILREAKVKPMPWFEKVQARYAASLEWCLDHKLAPLGAVVVLFAFCVWRVTLMGMVMLPNVSSTEISMSVTTPSDMTREQSYEMAGQILETAMGLDMVEEVGVTTDTTIYGVDVGMLGSTISNLLSTTSTGYGTYAYNIKLEAGASASDAEQVGAALEEAMTQYDCTSKVTIDGISEITSMLGSGLSVTIYGNDFETLQSLSDQVVEMVNGTEGFANATTGLGKGDQTIELHIDKDKARAAGLTVAQAYQAIAAKLTTSTDSTTISINGESMTVKVVNDTDPLTVENLMDMTFNTTNYAADGSQVAEVHTLREFAEITYGTTPDSIIREDQTRCITVTADTLDGYNTTVQARQLQDKLDQWSAEGNLPEGYSVSLSGETSNVNDIMAQMAQWLALALPFVYLVMVAQFQSLLSPFIVLFTIPLAFTGGMIGLLALGEQLSLMSLMGFIVLMGTVVNNGILFVDYTNQLRLGGMDRREALVATGRTRMRPILMTALTTILGMVMVLFSDDMASQLMSSMAVVIIGGLAYATFMTLYIVPMMYDVFFKRMPRVVDVGGDDLDDVPDDAAEFLSLQNAARALPGAAPKALPADGTAADDKK